jgi:hypothetical protein
LGSGCGWLRGIGPNEKGFLSVFQRKCWFNFLPFPLSSQGLLQVSQGKLPVDLATFKTIFPDPEADPL